MSGVVSAIPLQKRREILLRADVVDALVAVRHGRASTSATHRSGWLGREIVTYLLG